MVNPEMRIPAELNQPLEKSPLKKMTPREIRDEARQGAKPEPAKPDKKRSMDARAVLAIKKRLDADQYTGTHADLKRRLDQSSFDAYYKELDAFDRAIVDEQVGRQTEVRQKEKNAEALAEATKSPDAEERPLSDSAQRAMRRMRAGAAERSVNRLDTFPRGGGNISGGVTTKAPISTYKPVSDREPIQNQPNKELTNEEAAEYYFGQPTKTKTQPRPITETAKSTAQFQKIRITPELRAEQKKEARKDIENAYAKLVDAEDALAEAEKNRPGAFSRFFSRFKIGKPSAAEIAYQQAYQDEKTSPAELKKLEAAAIEATTSKTSAAEMTYQQALGAVEEAKKMVEEAEKFKNAVEESEPKKTTPKKTIHTRYGLHLKAESETAPKTISPQKPTVQAGEYEIKFKSEPARAPRKVEVNLPKQASEPKISPEDVMNARQQLENYIKTVSFTYPEHKLMVLQNAAFQENLADNNFQGDFPTLEKVIKRTLTQLAKDLKLKPHEEIASLAELMSQKDKRTKNMTSTTTAAKNFRHYLALKDLEQNARGHYI